MVGGTPTGLVPDPGDSSGAPQLTGADNADGRVPTLAPDNGRATGANGHRTGGHRACTRRRALDGWTLDTRTLTEEVDRATRA